MSYQRSPVSETNRAFPAYRQGKADIFACRRVQNSRVANVFEDRIADVWVCEMEAYREYDKFKKCSKCELKAWCRGCPAVACGAHGDFYDADPQCWKEIE